MEYERFLDIRKQLEVVVKQSSLEIITPKGKDIVSSISAEDLQRLPPRDLIFFDELSNVYAILRSSSDSIHDLLQFLQVTISAHATTTAADGHANTNVSKQELATHRFDATAYWSLSKIGTAQSLIWKEELHLPRPRSRASNPAIFFTCALTIKTDIAEQAARDRPQFLPSLATLSPNVLDSLYLGGHGESNLYLAEAKITKVAPASSNVDEVKLALRGVSKKALPIVPAIIPRLRYTALADKVLLSIQIEAPPALSGAVIIESLAIDVPAASIERLDHASAQQRLQPGDELDIVYRLVSHDRVGGGSPLATVSITINASVVQEQDQIAGLRLKWQTQIDMSYAPTIQYCSWQDGKAAVAAEPRSTGRNVIFNFTAPPQVRIDNTFQVKFRCVNNTERTRKFAVEVDVNDQEVSTSALAVTPRVSLSPIEAKGCGEAFIEYIALAVGALDLGLLHVVDLDTQESVLVETLPSVEARS